MVEAPVLYSRPSRSPARAAVALAVALLALAAGAPAATILVDTLEDDASLGGGCSLRSAIVAANSDSAFEGCPGGSGPDRIEFSVTGAIVLDGDLPVISKDTTIAGPPLAASGLPTLTVNGANHRIFTLDGAPNGRRLRLERLTVRNGQHAAGGCIGFATGDHLEVVDARVLQCESSASGGGIFGDGGATLLLRRSTVANNEAVGAAGVFFVGEGYLTPVGEPTATFLVEDSTISGNVVAAEASGAGFVSGFANGAIRRSTFSGNSTQDAGAGVMVIYGVVEIDASTITDNTADSNGDDGASETGGGLYVVGDAGVSATVRLHSTVIGNNFMGAIPSDVVASTNGAILSEGFNLVGVRDGAAAFFAVGAPNGQDDWVGTRAAPVLAGLGLLADNGGPTDTHLPSPGSLLVDRGECAEAIADQRGFGNLATLLRPVDQPLIPDASDGCDIGAAEENAEELPDALFHDDFESGSTGAWSATVP